METAFAIRTLRLAPQLDHCIGSFVPSPLDWPGGEASARFWLTSIDFLWEVYILALHRLPMGDMPESSVEVLRGTLDLLILKAVSWAPTHGYGVARWIEQATSDVLQIEEGSLYPALHRLEVRGWIASEWGT
jgi:hypothetical protein